MHNVIPEISIPTQKYRIGPSAAERWRVFGVFGASCLRRETLAWGIYPFLLIPLLVAGFFGWSELASRSRPQQGRLLFQTLTGVAAFFVFVGGVRFASKAVCWEVSRELRDLVRLTGIDPRTLLWCQTTLCRWWIVGFSILLIFPLAMFAVTLGGVTVDQWIMALCWLVLIGVLTSGFAMIASVSSGRAQNAETTAATATFLMMLFYHVFFWLIPVAVVCVCYVSSGNFSVPSESFADSVIEFAVRLPPAIGLYKAIQSPGNFTPFDPVYWLHLLTGICCIRMASVVMRNRFRVTTQGDQDSSEKVSNKSTPNVTGLDRDRPRCSDRPFFWKDAYILGGGRRSQFAWMVISGLALGVVIWMAMMGAPLVGLVAMCLAPICIVTRFDALLAAEFRNSTWAGLMMLPIDLRVPVWAKVEAAAWERQSLIIPASVAAAIGCSSDALLVFKVATIAFLASVLMIEISILNWFNTKIWWYGPIVGFVIVVMIIALVVVWAVFSSLAGFWITLGTLGLANMGFYWNIVWRMNHWSDD